MFGVKKKKCYISDFTTYNLKQGLVCVNKFYDDVSYDNTISTLLESVGQYKDIKFWNPTLVKTKNSFYIYSINESLFELIKNLELSDDPKTLVKLSQYGISIDDSVIQNNELLKFASDFFTSLDIDNIKHLPDWLNMLDYDLVFLGSNIIYNKTITDDIKSVLGGIKVSVIQLI